MPQLLLISSDPHIIETVQSLSDYDVLLVPEITTANHAEILAKMADVAIALIDTAAVGDMSFYEKIGDNWHDDTPKIPIILLSNEDELDNLNAILEKPLVDFLTKPFSVVTLKHRITQSLWREKHKADEIAEFSGFTVAELKNPVVPIVAGTEIILKIFEGQFQFDHDNVLKILKMIYRSGKRFLNEIDNWRASAYAEAGKLWISTQALSFKPIIQKVTSLFDHDMAEIEQQLILEIPDNLPSIKCDEYLINTVFYELLDNARKYAGSYGKITIRAIHQSHEVYVTIQDTGYGIRSENLPFIFNRPYSGLKFVRHIIEKHGGRIWIESEVNKGTTVHFTLPVADNTPG